MKEKINIRIGEKKIRCFLERGAILKNIDRETFNTLAEIFEGKDGKKEISTTAKLTIFGRNSEIKIIKIEK